MMDRNEKIYFKGSMSFNDLLEMVMSGDIMFDYKGVGYNITMDDSPCIALISCGTCEEWFKAKKDYATYEDLLLNHVFNDGVPLLEALKKDAIGR